MNEKKVVLGSEYALSSMEYTAKCIDEIINYTSICESREELENVRLPLFNEGFEPYAVNRTYNGDGTANISILCDISNDDNLPTQIWFGSSVSDHIEVRYYDDLLRINELKYTNKLIDCRYMFKHCRKLEYINTINFNTDNVIDMHAMFFNCNNLTSLDVSNFNTSNVTIMANMFSYCVKLTELNLSNFNTSKVTTMAGMFSYCKLLTSLDVSNFDTSKVTTMKEMFFECPSLIELDISNFNTSKVTDMGYMFSGCNNLTSITFGNNFDTSNVIRINQMFYHCNSLIKLDVSNWDIGNVTSLENMFYKCESLTELDVSNWNTSKVVAMCYTFFGCSNLTSLDVSNWDVSNVTNPFGTSCMFFDCHKLTTIGNVGNWDTSSVTRMDYMFYNCTSLTELDVSNWNTSSATTMYGMFHSCKNLTSIDVSDWDTSNVTDMSSMFRNCHSLVELDVSSWNTSNIKPTGSSNGLYYMFAECRSLKKIIGIKNWNISNNREFSGMFLGCSNLEQLDLSGWTFNANAYHQSIFHSCNNLKILDISNWNRVSGPHITYYCSNLRYIKCDNVNVINSLLDSTDGLPNRTNKETGYIIIESDDLSGLNTEGLAAKNWQVSESTLVAKYKFDKSIYEDLIPEMNAEFIDYFIEDEIENEMEPNIITRTISSVNTLPTLMRFGTINTDGTIRVLNAESLLEVLNMNTAALKTMDKMFYRCNNVTSIQSEWNTSNVTDMNCMFALCKSLTSLDLSNFDTSKVTHMGHMFDSCYNLTSLDVSNFDTSKATNISYMFQDCRSLTELDVSNWDTSNVTTTSFMFNNCAKLTELDVSNWDTSNVTNMSWMFHNCKLLTSIDVSRWNVSKVTSMYTMFNNCASLVDVDVSAWDPKSVVSTQAMFADCYAIKEIDLSNWSAEILTQYNHMFDRCTALKTINFGDLNIITNCTFDVCVLEKIYTTNIDIIKPFVEADLPDRSEMETPGQIVIAIRDQIDEETMTKLAAKNWQIKDLVAQYKFDANTCEDLMPEFNPEFTEDMYEVHDSISEIVIDSKSIVLVPETEGVTHRNKSFISIIPNITYSCSRNINYIFYDENRNRISNGSTMIDGTLDIIPPTNARFLRFSCDDNVYPVITAKLVTRSIESKNGDLPTLMRFGHGGNDTENHEYSGPGMSLLKVIDLNTKELTSCYRMFKYCKRVEEINGINWDTSNVTDMSVMFYNCNKLTSLDVSKWDTGNVTNMSFMFRDCTKLTSIDVSNWGTSNVTNMCYMFNGCRSLTSLDVSGFNTNKVTNMSYMFHSCINLTLLDLSNFDTTNVTDMSHMFNNCQSLTSLDLNKWNTSNVTNMSSMFNQCIKLTSLDVSNWDTNNITDMRYIFSGCNKLTTLDVSGFNTSKVTDMRNMFAYCRSLTTLDVSNFNTSNVKDMSFMFYYANKIPSLNVSSWDVSKVEYAQCMFTHTIIERLDLSNWNFANLVTFTYDADILKGFIDTLRSLKILDLPNYDLTISESFNNNFTNFIYEVPELQYIRCKNLNNLNIALEFFPDRTGKEQGKLLTTEEILNQLTLEQLEALSDKNWTTTAETVKVAEYVYDPDVWASLIPEFNSEFTTYFIDDKEIEGEGVDDTTKVLIKRTIWSLGELPTMVRFGTLISLDADYVPGHEKALISVDYLNTDNLTSMNKMFKQCSNLISVNTEGWNTSNVTNMYSAFMYCNKLISLDVSDFNTSNVTDMNYMFLNCKSLTSIDVSNFDTSNVTIMTNMFCGCKSLTSINISNFDTSNVTNMNGMFRDCTLLTSIDLNNFDTSKVTNMSNMFRDCLNLTSIDVSNFDTSNVTTISYMFDSCNKLKKIQIFNLNHGAYMAYCFRNCSSLEALNLSHWNAIASNIQGFIQGCKSLAYANLSGIDVSQSVSSSYIMTECENLSVLNISNWSLNLNGDTDEITGSKTFLNCNTPMIVCNVASTIMKIYETIIDKTTTSGRGKIVIDDVSKLTSLQIAQLDAKGWDVVLAAETNVTVARINMSQTDIGKVGSTLDIELAHTDTSLTDLSRTEN